LRRLSEFAKNRDWIEWHLAAEGSWGNANYCDLESLLYCDEWRQPDAFEVVDNDTLFVRYGDRYYEAPYSRPETDDQSSSFDLGELAEIAEEDVQKKVRVVYESYVETANRLAVTLAA
jgi:hypothetical protein